MEIEKKGNKIIVTHSLKKNETYRLSEGSKFQSFTIMKKPQTVCGFSNITGDNLAILLIDYDNVDFDVVKSDYQLIQEKFNLPPAYVFQTKENNYHIVCLKKFLHSDIPEILSHTRCDDNYKSMPLRTPYRSYVLRVSDKKGSKKPRFFGLVGENNNLDYEVSSAHLDFLNKIYSNLPKIQFTKLDGLSEIKLQEYETG